MMTTKEPIDAARYVKMFPLDVPSTVALVIRLMGIVPRSKDKRDKDELARIRTAAAALRESGVALQDTWRIREESGTTKLRPLDLEWDAAWSALLDRIEPWSIFSPISDHADSAKKAASLIALLFANRLDFTQLELNAQWVEGKQRLDWIARDALRGDLVELAGEPFVARVEETHVTLGRALGLLGEPADPDLPLVVDLVGAKRRTQDAILAYLLQLMAVDAGASDALSAQLRGSLAVFDEFRDRARRAPSADGADTHATDTDETDAPPLADPSSPIPPLPTE